ncbi:MAG: hypothetical protein FWF70_02595 [Bacteroidetes bacterium]|nr:hypothetical protein [Bacteroidota bacterium]MCL1969693.1 hypothetical protein [Bacteroidota bacterium]
MKKIYNFLLRILPSAFCFLLYCTTFNVAAQCPGVNLELSQESPCFGQGVILMRITGNTANIDLRHPSQPQFQFYSYPSGAPATPWIPWGTSLESSYGGLLPGTYTAVLQAFCIANNIPTIIEATSTITVKQSSYDPLLFSAVKKSNTLACLSSGRIDLAFSNGTRPYTLTINGPTAYSGPTVIAIPSSANTYILDGLPAGTYILTLTDACGYGVKRTITIATIAGNGIASALGVELSRPAGTTSCNQVVPYTSPAPSDPEAAFLWANSSQYYEYAYTTTPTPPTTGWLPLPNDHKPVFTLPGSSGYCDFCNSGQQVYSHIRLIECPTIIETTQHSLSPYICNFNPNNLVSFAYTNGSNPETQARVAVTIKTHYGLCFPVQWKVTTEADPTTTICSGSFTNSSLTTNATACGNLTRGDNYILTLTPASPCNTPLNIQFTPPLPSSNPNNPTNGVRYFRFDDVLHQGLTGCNKGCAYRYWGFRRYPTNNTTTPTIIPEGTIIKYVSGPGNTALPWKGGFNVGDTYTTTGTNTKLIILNVVNPENTIAVECANYVEMPTGLYIFEITEPDGFIFETANNWDAGGILIHENPYFSSDFGYYIEATCDDPVLHLRGAYEYLNSNGIMNCVATTHQIIGTIPSNYYSLVDQSQHSNDYTTHPSWTLLPNVGVKYILRTFIYTQNSYCIIRRDTIEYTGAPPLNLKKLYNYLCDGSSTGNIVVEATGGNAPYTYTLYNQTTGLPIGDPITTSDACVFTNCVEGITYKVVIEDCNTILPIEDINMVDLMTSHLAFATVQNDCGTGGVIALGALALGDEATYQWTGPNGFSSTQQFPPLIIPATSVHNGEYVVLITAPQCNAPVTGRVSVEVVNETPPAPTVAHTTLHLTSPANVAAAAGVTPLPNHTLVWYMDGTPVPTPVNVAFPNDTTIYYDVLQDGGAGCMSEAIRITVIFRSTNPTITYEPNDGGAAGRAFIDTKIDECQLILTNGVRPLNFFKPGYVFVEWNTEPDGSGISYLPGDCYDGIDDIILYAIWRRDCNTKPIVITYKGKKIETAQ